MEVQGVPGEMFLFAIYSMWNNMFLEIIPLAWRMSYVFMSLSVFQTCEM